MTLKEAKAILSDCARKVDPDDGSIEWINTRGESVACWYGGPDDVVLVDTDEVDDGGGLIVWVCFKGSEARELIGST